MLFVLKIGISHILGQPISLELFRLIYWVNHLEGALNVLTTTQTIP